MQHSSLLAPFISYEKNLVLWIGPLLPRLDHKLDDTFCPLYRTKPILQGKWVGWQNLCEKIMAALVQKSANCLACLYGWILTSVASVYLFIDVYNNTEIFICVLCLWMESNISKVSNYFFIRKKVKKMFFIKWKFAKKIKNKIKLSHGHTSKLM